ncbi:MAG: type II methionyl aminopeptidase, partial [Methanobacteriota archaeon]
MDADVRESLLRAGRISREVRERAVALVKEGALLLDVAEEAEDLMRKRRAKPAFPTCISID